MVKEVEWPALATFEQKPYFYTEGAATGVVFRAPVNGKTTSGSTYPRSELRQMYANGDPAAWSNKNDTWTMEAFMAFAVLPSNGNLVGMQIHDSNDDVTVLRIEGTDIYATKGDDPHAFPPIVTGYTLGTFMKVKVEARKGGGIRWYVNDAFKRLTHSGTISGAYFKAGAYPQDNQGSSSEYGQTVFKTLKVWRS